MEAPQDLDTAHPVTDEPAPLVKVQRWYHLRRLFVFDFGWHTKDFRLISMTETEPDEFVCTFKPRYRLYRKLLPLLLGRSETLPYDTIFRMVSRSLYPIERWQCSTPGRTWGILMKFSMDICKPIVIDPNARQSITIKARNHRCTRNYDSWIFEFDLDDGSATGVSMNAIVDDPRSKALQEESADASANPQPSPADPSDYPHRFSRRWIRRNSMFELNHGWQLKEYRPKVLRQIDDDTFVISFRPRYRLIRMIAPLLLKRPELVAADCAIRMLDRSILAILRASGRLDDKCTISILSLKLSCRKRLVVRWNRLMLMSLTVKEQKDGCPNQWRCDFSIGDEGDFFGTVLVQAFHPESIGCNPLQSYAS